MGATLTYLYAKKRPFQIDANMGFTSAVYEMLLYSNDNKVKVFPALPSNLKHGSIKGIKAMGGSKFDIIWDENSCDITIYPGHYHVVELKVVGFDNEYKKYDLSDKPLELHFQK